MSEDTLVNQVFVHKVVSNDGRWSCEKVMEQGRDPRVRGD